MKHGKFSGEPESVWLTEDGTEDRRMRILQDFRFIDPQKKTWWARADTVVDGASIPRPLWTLVGSPFVGDYRRASIVHDVACVEAGDNVDARRAADRMFFHACRAGGCSIWQAILLYIGVRIGAATTSVTVWRAAVATEKTGPRIRRTEAEIRLEVDFQEIADRVLAHGETDDSKVLEERTDMEMERIVGSK